MNDVLHTIYFEAYIGIDASEIAAAGHDVAQAIQNLVGPTGATVIRLTAVDAELAELDPKLAD